MITPASGGLNVPAGRIGMTPSHYGTKLGKTRYNPRGTAPSGGRVREWRLGIVRLVSIPCHLEPDVRFSLIRLSDNLLPAVFKVRLHIFRVGRRILNPVGVARL